MDKVYKKEFELRNIPFPDKKLEIEINLYAKGMMEFMSDADENDIANIIETLSELARLVIGSFALEGRGYEDVHRKPILPAIKELLNKTYGSESSFEIKNMYFTEIHPDDADYKKIIEARKRLRLNEKAVSSANNPTITNQVNEWTCHKCGKPARGKFCPSCGTPKQISNGDVFSANQLKHISSCSLCGLDLTNRPTGIKFCPKCGNKLIT